MEFQKLSRKEKNGILDKIQEEYNLQEDKIKELLEGQFFYSGKNKIRYFSGNIDLVNIPSFQKKLKVQNIGIYFLNLESKKSRFSFNFSTLFGKYARKNFVVLSEKQEKSWFLGIDIHLFEEQKNILENGFIIVKSLDNLVIGMGNYFGEDLINFLPKDKRVRSSE